MKRDGGGSDVSNEGEGTDVFISVDMTGVEMRDKERNDVLGLGFGVDGD